MQRIIFLLKKDGDLFLDGKRVARNLRRLSLEAMNVGRIGGREIQYLMCLILDMRMPKVLKKCNPVYDANTVLKRHSNKLSKLNADIKAAATERGVPGVRVSKINASDTLAVRESSSKVLHNRTPPGRICV